MKQITPKWFPGENVKNRMTEKKLLVNKIGIDENHVVSYLCWDGKDYDWFDEYQITSEPRKAVGFTINID